jgi:hypothetical protein
MSNKQKKLARHRFWFLVLLLLIPLFVVGLLNSRSLVNRINKTDPSDAVSVPVNGINYGPPTENEIAEGNSQKEKNIQAEKNRMSFDKNSTQKVTVIITDAGQYGDKVEVRAFVPDYYKDGTCTIKFTQGPSTIEKQTPAYRDVSTTICTNPLLNRADFSSSGTWQLVVSYSSMSVSGTSEPVEVNIN